MSTEPATPEQLAAIEAAEGMTIERARAITAACLKHRIAVTVGLYDPKECPLPTDCTLEEMLKANRIMSGPAGLTRNPDGTTRITIVSDPRGIAASYALREFGGPGPLIDAVGYRLRGPGDEAPEEEDEEEDTPPEAPYAGAELRHRGPGQRRCGGPERCPRPCSECSSEHHHFNDMMVDFAEEHPQHPAALAGADAWYQCKHCKAWMECGGEEDDTDDEADEGLPS